MLAGIGINCALALGKGLAGLLGHSYALVADALESVSDVITSIGVLIGLKFAAKPADDSHPQGHGKAEPIAAAFVALVSIVAACALAVESVRMMRTPHDLPAPFTLGVLVIVLVVKEAMFRYATRVGRSVGSTAVQAEAHHQRSDAITSLAAFIGISFALVMGKGYESADDWAALLSSTVIAVNGIRLFTGAVRELLDSAAPQELSERVAAIALEVSGIEGTDKCIVRKMGFDYLVELDVLVEPELTVRRGHELAHEVQEHVRRSMPEVTRVLVHVEPADLD